ncbi:MAG: hypothetical protein CMD33_03650 [Flavobacteriales bacterium]|nr:hypothetical protein [Flavobacteriales bacterium]
MLDVATARTFKGQLKQVYNGEALRAKRVPIKKEDIIKGKDGKLRPKIPLYADQRSRAARNRAVYFGRRWLTARGGLDRTQLEPNGNGRIVSKAARAQALERGDFGRLWRECVRLACEELSLERYTIPKKGTPLYARTVAIYETKKIEVTSNKKQEDVTSHDEGGGEPAKGSAETEDEVPEHSDKAKVPNNHAKSVLSTA